MQLWQQQLMCKQLQQRQRQQQLQQLDQGVRQLTPHSQLPAAAKPATGNQSPATLNEMPINDAYNYMWPNNFVGGISNLPSNSQMFVAGNTNLVQPSCSASMQNLANGVVISNDQSQAMRSMGFMPQQIDQYFHGMPVSGTSSVDQCSHSLGMANNCHDLMTKAAVTIAEKASYPSSSFQSDQQLAAQGCLQDKTLATQNFQGRHALGNSPIQVLGNDVTSGNFQPANNLQNNDQFQEFHGRQEQDDSSGNLQEKPVSQVGTSTGVASLDPIEQKILFGTDDDDNWGISLGGSLMSGMGGDMHEHPSENDYYGAFPSIHSGSWSALMQEAVQASSSDKGLQEEWSGLSFQRTEQLVSKPLLTTNDNGKRPAAWDDSNLQSATSLTSRPFPLFNDANVAPSSSTAPCNQHFLESSHEENNMVLTEASHASSKSSSQGANNKEVRQSQNHTKLIEGGFQAQMPSASGVWAGQAIEQHENSSGDIKFKSQDIGGGWGGQQNLPLSNVPIQRVNRLSNWNTSYPMASRSDNTSNYHENHDNLWNIGENHVTLNSGLQPVKSDIGSPKMQAEDSLAGNFGSIRNPNMLKMNQDMHQQVINEQKSVYVRHFANTCVSSEGDKNEENQNQPSRRPQTWELSVSATAERLADNYEKEKEHGRVVSGRGNVGDAAKEKSLLTSNNQYPLMSGSQKSSIQCGQRTVGSKMLQNSLGNLKTAEPSFAPNHLLSLQGFSNSVFHGSKSGEQSTSGKSQFAGHIVCNDPVEVSKRTAVEAENLQARNTKPLCAPSSPFDGSTAQYSQNETIAQASNNMLELLHKVDQSRNGNSVNASDLPAHAAADISITHPHFGRSSNLRGFGLRLAPPSQKQPLSNYATNSQKSLNDIKSGQSDHEAGYQDQSRSNSTSSVRPVPPLDESFKAENWDKISSLSGQKRNEPAEANKYFNSMSATASDFPLVGNQLEEQQQLQQQDISSAKDHLEQQRQQQHISNTTAHEVLGQSVNFSFGNQANLSALVKNASLIKQLHDSHDGAVAGQSVLTSLPTLAGRFLTSGVASIAETRAPVGSQFSSGGTDHTKPTFAGFSQITSSGQQLPVVETKSGSQSSISGMSQQAGFSKMLHNVWTNISVQRQAGMNPLFTPNVLQSIINHGRDTSSWGLPKASNQVNKDESAPPEVGTSSVNSQNKEESPVEGRSLNLMHMEKVDVVHKARNASQGGESVLKPPDGGSSVPISSLVRLHEQDVNKAKNGQDPALSSRVLHAPLTNIVSSSSDIGISGHMSKPSDVQQQNYSLLHQIQSMKASDSDLNKMIGNISKGAAFSSNTSQTNFNTYQRFDHGQNSVSRFPADGKVGADSQISFPSDAKMLSFASNDNEEKDPSISTAGRHDLQTHMHPLGTSSTTNVLGGSECTRISPQMAPSWFEHYRTYQNGRMVALYDAQRSGKAAIQHCFLQKVPARMDDSNVVEQRLDNSQVGSYRQGTLATKIAPNESSPSLLPPNIMDRDIILRSKKRKSATADLPWHKMVTECPERLQSMSMADLDWTLAANRLMEKVDDEAETVEDDPSIPQSRRRLILTTQLMHQLIPTVPAALLKGEATSSYESVTSFVAKSALADACSLVSSSKNDSHVLSGNENMVFGELRTSKKVGDDTFSKFVEDLIGRSKKLEADFSRLDKGTSILDVRLECQELERFSIVNRLGKFHGRTHADGVEVSSASETVPRRTFPQRYITALSVPGNLPEGVLCLSL